MTTSDIPRKSEWADAGATKHPTDWTCVGVWCVVLGYVGCLIAAAVKYSLFGVVGFVIASMGALLMLSAFDRSNAWRAAGQLLGGLLVVLAGISICGAGR